MPHLRRQLCATAITTRTGVRSTACAEDNLICYKVTISSLNTCSHTVFSSNFRYLAIGKQFTTVLGVNFNESIYNVLRFVAYGKHPVATFNLGFQAIAFQKAHNVIIAELAQSTVQETSVTGNVLDNILQLACVSNITASFTGNKHLFTGLTHFFNNSYICTISSSSNASK